MLFVANATQEEGITLELSRETDYDGVCEALYKKLEGGLPSPVMCRPCGPGACVLWDYLAPSRLSRVVCKHAMSLCALAGSVPCVQGCTHVQRQGCAGDRRYKGGAD